MLNEGWTIRIYRSETWVVDHLFQMIKHLTRGRCTASSTAFQVNFSRNKSQIPRNSVNSVNSCKNRKFFNFGSSRVTPEVCTVLVSKMRLLQRCLK